MFGTHVCRGSGLYLGKLSYAALSFRDLYRTEPGHYTGVIGQPNYPKGTASGDIPQRQVVQPVLETLCYFT